MPPTLRLGLGLGSRVGAVGVQHPG
jgi:hypothetical protein